MPTRMPVVNGMLSRPASVSTRSRTCRVLVRAAVVRAARFGEQPAGGGLQHHAHARRDRLEPLQLRPAHHTGIQVRQQAGPFQHRDGRGPDVVQGGVVAPLVQPGPGLRPAQFRPVAQGEQRLLAAQRGALGGHLHHLVDLQVGGRQPVRHGGERAVVATVPAQPGQRDEHLAGVADPRMRPIPDGGRHRHQLGQRLAPGRHQHGGLGDVQRGTVPGPAQGPADGGFGRLLDAHEQQA